MFIGHGHQSDDPAPEERNVPAMYKSSNDISLPTELAEISQSHCSINIPSLTGLAARRRRDNR